MCVQVQGQLYCMCVQVQGQLYCMCVQGQFSHVTQLYKIFNFLKLNEIYRLELAKFMNQFYNNKLPKVFTNKTNEESRKYSFL